MSDVSPIITTNREAMNSLLCPISPQRVNANSVRITACYISLLLIFYLLTNSLLLISFMTIDFFIRSFTNTKFSPLSWLANHNRKILRLGDTRIDKAPKIFAARVGLIFTVAILVFTLTGLINAARVTAMVLLLFASLEALLNVCMGCLAYTYIIYPFLGPEK